MMTSQCNYPSSFAIAKLRQRLTNKLNLTREQAASSIAICHYCGTRPVHGQVNLGRYARLCCYKYETEWKLEEYQDILKRIFTMTEKARLVRANGEEHQSCLFCHYLISCLQIKEMKQLIRSFRSKNN